ncbi:MAG: hypothetical protein ACI86H_000716 [bacterium]|jgi:hypothetical protein
METVFDHNITDKELRWLVSFGSIEKVKKKIKGNSNPDFHFRKISDLYRHRKDYKKAFEYVEKMRDSEAKTRLGVFIYKDEQGLV